jgi:HlyD family secretion protein
MTLTPHMTRMQRAGVLGVRAWSNLFCFVCAVIVGCRETPDDVSREPVGPAAPRQVVALGRLEPAGGVITISAVPGEKLKNLAEGVVDGAKVAAGAELARSESFGLRQTQVDAADLKLQATRKRQESEIGAARAQVEQALAGQAQAEAKYQETLAQQEQLQNLGEAAAIAEEDLAQLEKLQASDPELVTDQQIRRRRNAAARARSEYDAAAASYPHALEAAKRAADAAAANVKLARQNLATAEALDQTAIAEMEKRIAEETRNQSVLSAPQVEGGSSEYTVLRVLMQPGEFVTQLPVMEIGDLSKMVAVAEVYEADAKELAVGQSATIRSPAFSGKFADGVGAGQGGIRGKVTRIGTTVGAPELTNRNPLAPADRSVVEVRVEIDPADAEATAEAARRVGLQVTVEFGEKPAEPTGGAATGNANAEGS